MLLAFKILKVPQCAHIRPHLVAGPCVNYSHNVTINGTPAVLWCGVTPSVLWCECERRGEPPRAHARPPARPARLDIPHAAHAPRRRRRLRSAHGSHIDRGHICACPLDLPPDLSVWAWGVHQRGPHHHLHLHKPAHTNLNPHVHKTCTRVRVHWPWESGSDGNQACS